MSRNKQLDFLRFCGVALVMIHHLPLIVSQSIFGKFFEYIQNGGWVGVDLFFVLSGYLVSGLIIKEYKLYNTFNAKTFLVRRGFKIYPTYYFFIIYQFLFSYFLTNHPQKLVGLFNESVFVANYFSSNNTHLWSISVEEHFYFALALLFIILIKFKMVNLRPITYIYISLLILGISFRLYNYLNYNDYNFERDYTRSHIRFDSLFFGVLLSFISNYRKSIFDRILTNKFKPIYIILSLLFLSTNFILNRYEFRFVSVINLAINPICFGYILINIINYNNRMFTKVITPFSYIGMYSYSIYLFHKHFLHLSGHFFKEGTSLYYIFYAFAAVIGGIAISKVIEYPLIRYREKYFPSKSVKIVNKQVAT